MFVKETYSNDYIDVDFNITDTSDVKAVSEMKRNKVSSSGLPSSYSLVDEGYVTEVKNQGFTGSCWAFSSCASAESNMAKVYGKNFSLAAAHLAWFTYTSVKDTSDVNYGENYYVTDSGAYLTGGSWYRAAATLARFSGFCKEETYAFDDTNEIDESERYSSDSGYVLKDCIVLSQDKVKSWVQNNGGVYYSYPHNANYMNKETSSYCISGSDNATAKHAVTIVGWDDNYSRENFKIWPDEDGAWLCKNSYGAGRDNDDYFWVSYSSQGDTFVGFTVQENIYNNNYGYNNISCNSYFPTTESLSVSNVFTAVDEENLDKVSIVTYNNKTDIRIQVYTNLTGDAPDSGFLIYDDNFEISGKGYHCIDIDNVYLAENSRFAIVATYSGNGTIGVPCENNDSSSTYTANAGESFIYYDNSWVDTTEKYEYAKNFYIRALTVSAEGGHEHDYITKTVNATCTKDGFTKTYCKSCGQILNQTISKSTGHNLTETVIEPGCTTEGYTKMSCSCGYEEISCYTEPVGHSYVETGLADENFFEFIYGYTCSHCEDKITKSVKKNIWQSFTWLFKNLLNWIFNI